ncbi:MAG: methyltransferase domain-containing protein [Planctomycetota bacterium]|nr:MAG: methyltransferase domain-containing protein [Planctomycetota bacterium]
MHTEPSFVRNLGKVSKTYRDSGIYGRFINQCRLDAWRMVTERFDPPRAQIVDVGCASGSWADNWRQLGFQRIVGIDPNPDVLEDASAVMDEVHTAFASELGSYFTDNAICAANGVVVHILEDDQTVAFLRDIAETLAPDGLLVYSVLNAAYYYNAGRAEWFGPNSCVRTLETQRRFAHEAGLEILDEIGTFIDPWALPDLEFIAGDSELRERWQTYQVFVDLANVCRGRSITPFSEVLIVAQRSR